jgi:signal transduction histidine kinase
VAPFFHQTRWFYTLCAAALGALMWLATRLRVRRVRAEMAATLGERNRVARELHDTLLQGMAAAALRAEALRTRVAPLDGRATLEAEELRNLIEDGIKSTRSFLWELRDQDETLTLRQELEIMAARLAGRAAATVEVEVLGDPFPLPALVNSAFARIGQEATINSLQHADATTVKIRATYSGRRLELTVTDDGRGFDTVRAQGIPQKHFGLQGMRERAEAIRASFVITSAPGKGTSLKVGWRRR